MPSHIKTPNSGPSTHSQKTESNCKDLVFKVPNPNAYLSQILLSHHNQDSHVAPKRQSELFIEGTLTVHMVLSSEIVYRTVMLFAL